MPEDKRVELAEAIERFIPDGSSVALGLGLETCIPFAAGHEIIRQKKRDLVLIGPISDILFDQIIGAGCVRRVRAAWVGNVITGSGYRFRSAVESGTLEVEDHSNLTVAMAIRAAALGVPYLPTKTALGSDLFKTNANLKTVTCPFSGEELTAVKALQPDVAVVHVQRADPKGGAHSWGNLGISRESCLASRCVIVTAEEIVGEDVIASDPNRVITPGYRVAAVVHAPWGGYPSPVPGYYNRDHQAFIDYRDASRTESGYREWLTEWVDNAAGPSAVTDRIGEKRRGELALKRHLYSEPADFGY